MKTHQKLKGSCLSESEIMFTHNIQCPLDVDWILIIVFSTLHQPTRLNVFKNDQDTWDYTNPNLSGQGTVSKHPSFLTLLSTLTATVGYR